MVDLAAPPDPRYEVRLAKPGGAVVSMWMPMDAHTAARVMQALGRMGFEFMHTPQSMYADDVKRLGVRVQEEEPC